jgi:hypothetical protein
MTKTVVVAVVVVVVVMVMVTGGPLYGLDGVDSAPNYDEKI